MPNAPLHYMTITELAALIEARQVSPVEITDYMLRRIEDIDGKYKSYATVMSDQAEAAAKAAEAEIAAGQYRGPLHGVPFAVKDLCFTTGVRTMGGSKVYLDHVPAFDATVVAKLNAAGAVPLGKLNLTEGAMGGYNPALDLPLNPWNTERWAGSSSSGSGVATAAGLCFGSLGSDTGGSIRFPAAACGTVGLKPTWGRVSRYGVLALAESLDHVGPMTRSSADAAIALQAIAGQDPNDPTSLPAPVPDMLDGIDGGVKGVRIGLDANYATDGVDPELAAAVLAGVNVMEELGAEIVPVQMPDVDAYLPAWPILCSAEAVAAHRENYPSRRDDYGPLVPRLAGYGRVHKRRGLCRGEQPPRRTQRAYPQRLQRHRRAGVSLRDGAGAPHHARRDVRPPEWGQRDIIPAIHRALRLQRRAHNIAAMRTQRRRLAPEPAIRRQALVRAAAVPHWTRLRAGDRLAQPAPAD